MSRSSSPSGLVLLLCAGVLFTALVGLGSRDASSSRDSAVESVLGDGEDLTGLVAEWEARYDRPEAEFEPGTATAREDNSEIELERTDAGFTITLPTGAPIATPAVANGRLYASGGFSSQEFYCFDATTGETLWGVDLSDDGPSWAVVADDSVIFNTESCTIFALDATTGEHRWSWYLGDPLMSSPTVANGRVYAVYPVESTGGGGGFEGGGFGGGGFGGFSVDDPGATDGEAITEREPPAENTESPPSGEEPADPAEGIFPEPTVEPEVDEDRPTHALACFDLETGEVLWQRWVDSDCTSAPIVAGDDVHVATFTGAVFRFGARDGALREARQLAATSAPVLANGRLYVTRRAETSVSDTGEPLIEECVVVHSRFSRRGGRVTYRCPAPWLDAEIQRHSEATGKAGAFESFNGIGGGFGGGFVAPGGGSFSVDDPGATDQTDPEEPGPPQTTTDPDEPAQQPLGGNGEWMEVDGLAVTQRQAILNLGLGNVSTLQGYQGSRPLHWDGRNFNTMGDHVTCTAATDGRVLWRTPLEGDLETVGGHLGSPPVPVGDDLLVATVGGKLLRLDRDTGHVERTIDVDHEMRFAPTVANGHVYVGTQDGRIVAVRMDHTGRDWPQWGGNPAHSGVVDPAE